MLFFSRLHPKKGLERLLTAVGELSADHPDLVLLVAGAGTADYEQALRRHAETAAGRARVVWLGLVSGAAKWDAFAAADVFVLASDYENFGIVVLEALLAGTPAVISDQVYLADAARTPSRSGRATRSTSRRRGPQTGRWCCS